MNDNVFFLLLRIGIQSQDIGNLAELSILKNNQIDWNKVYNRAVEQGVAALVWDGLIKLEQAGLITKENLPNRIQKLNWICNVDRIETTYHEQETAISELTKFYLDHNIQLMLLKGLGLSLLYPIPCHRACGDIDIWLFGKQKIADELISREKGIKVNQDKHQHTIFYWKGVMVENHFEFMHVHGHRSNILLEEQLKRFAYKDYERITIGDTEMFIPSANFNALFLLRHAASHFAAERIVIRHIIDWALFIKRYHHAIDWDTFISIVRYINMDKFLNCINAISIEYLGLDASYIPEFTRDTMLEERVLNDILDPEFNTTPPKNAVKMLLYKYRRWWNNRWKHKLVYREGLVETLIVQIYSHLLKPKSLFH